MKLWIDGFDVQINRLSYGRCEACFTYLGKEYILPASDEALALIEAINVIMRGKIMVAK